MSKAVFLDRDGVINRMERGKYVTSWEQFEFLEGAREAVAELAKTDFKIIIITNQSPINRGLAKEETIQDIHRKMTEEIESSGGRIDAVYYCPHRPDEGCGCRKPESGLFLRAQADFGIDFSLSWFVGDFESDEEAAKRLGINFVLAEGPGGLKRAVGKILG